MPTDSRRPHSGEWQNPGYVTDAQFLSFAEDCRSSFRDITENIQGLRKDLSAGHTRFELMHRDIEQQKVRNNEHSSKISKLENDRLVREEREKQKEQYARPRKNMGFEIIKTLITAGILGLLAVGYNIWRDHESSRLLKEAQAKQAIMNPDSAVPATATPP